MDAAKAVANGVDLLNVVEPEWYNRIKLDELYMDDPRHCVLGQVFPSFSIGLDALGLVHFEETVAYGFEGDEDEETGDRTESYEELNELWTNVIANLQEHPDA